MTLGSGVAGAPPSARSTPPAARAATAGLTAVASLALLKLILHLATTGTFGYSYFVDELYYLACSEHLAWGYVDMPPLFPAITAVIRATLGDSLPALRILPALAGAALVLMTGWMARDLGGGRFAMAIAALAVVAAPGYLALHSLHTMNALEPIFWMGCAWILIRLARGGSERLWIAFGLIAGVGLLNKDSMALFGVGAVAGLLFTPGRRALARPWIWIGGALALAVVLPNLLWMISHGFPHLELLANIRADRRNVSLDPLKFVGEEILFMHPLALPLWLGGLGWFLFGKEGRRYRALGIAFIVILLILLGPSGRTYYLFPAFPMLFAGGGVLLERWMQGRLRGWPRPAYATLLAATGAFLAPTALPCLPPEAYVRYAEATGLQQPRVETHRLGPLPQLFADRFGWKEMAETVARIYHSLPPEEQAKAAIFGQIYGQASTIDLYGPALGLPKAISGHLSYWLWGPRDWNGDVLIVMDDDQETLQRLFESVTYGGRVEHPYSMPYEHFDVWVCRRLKGSVSDLWPKVKKFH